MVGYNKLLVPMTEGTHSLGGLYTNLMQNVVLFSHNNLTLKLEATFLSYNEDLLYIRI